MAVPTLDAASDAVSPRVTGDGPPAIDVVGVWRRFKDVDALRGVSLEVEAGQIRALLGPNGAGKTTLLRILTGLLTPDRGDVGVLGLPLEVVTTRGFRRHVGFIPSGDRTFYLRLTGMQNLIFFGRMGGLTKRRATERSWEAMEAVGLTDAAKRRVGLYSHGMQKRLAVARTLLTDPKILYVDEATHDLDPDAAATIRDLIREAAGRGVAVIWTTQRVEEIRGFADRVTLLDRGEVRFEGTVPQLLAVAPAGRYLVRLVLTVGDARPAGANWAAAAAAAVGALGVIAEGADPEHFFLTLPAGGALGPAIAALEGAGICVRSVAEEGSGIEDAFRFLTRAGADTGPDSDPGATSPVVEGAT